MSSFLITISMACLFGSRAEVSIFSSITGLISSICFSVTKFDLGVLGLIKGCSNLSEASGLRFRRLEESIPASGCILLNVLLEGVEPCVFGDFDTNSVKFSSVRGSSTILLLLGVEDLSLVLLKNPNVESALGVGSLK